MVDVSAFRVAVYGGNVYDAVVVVVAVGVVVVDADVAIVVDVVDVDGVVAIAVVDADPVFVDGVCVRCCSGW